MAVRTRFDIAPLQVSFDQDYDFLNAVEFGIVVDGVHPDRWRPLSERFAYLARDVDDDVEVGFQVKDFSTIDPERDVPAIFEGPRFDVPVLGLAGATAGEILLAAATFLEGESTVNRLLFDSATAARGDEAVTAWKQCLQAGDLTAHYGLGYTLLDLGQYRLAYRHLRYYTELLPDQAWGWSYRGKAAEQLGELVEARECYRRAIALDEELERDEQTTAADDLRALLTRHGELEARPEPARPTEPDRPRAPAVPDRPFDSAEYLLSIVDELEPASGHPEALFLAGGPLTWQEVRPLAPPQGGRRVGPAGRCSEIDPAKVRQQLPEFNQLLSCT
jgi:tetratricopeptide (TPR) repeat protein